MTNGSVAAVPMPKALSAAERTRRNALEAGIERHLDGFVETCNALLEIRDSLLGDDYLDFEDYCARRWQNFSDRHGRRLKSALGVMQLIGPIGPSVVLRESHLREFGPLSEHPDLIQPTWAQVEELARNGNKLTATLVRRVVKAAVKVALEAVQTQGFVAVGEESLALEAALTSEMSEETARQTQHIADGSPWQWQRTLLLLPSGLTALQRDMLGAVGDSEFVKVTFYTRKEDR